MQPSITRSPARGLQALLREALEYAGMFPPARLELEEAIGNYAKYRGGPAAWFLSRFICPANRLAELGSHRGLFAEAGALRVSVLGLQAGSRDDFIPRLRESFGLVSEFQTICGPTACIDGIELALTSDLVNGGDESSIADVIRAAVEVIEASGTRGVTPFFEAPSGGQWRPATRATIRAIARHNASWNEQTCPRAAFKLRTGGVRADAFPSIEQIVLVITACLEQRVRFKCTAGLHHPVRRYHDSVGTTMHGFLNVFAAAVLAHAHSAGEVDLRSVLADENPLHFRFQEDGLTWERSRASVEQIESARRDFILSFGSCSFEEPLEELAELQML